MPQGCSDESQFKGRKSIIVFNPANEKAMRIPIPSYADFNTELNRVFTKHPCAKHRGAFKIDEEGHVEVVAWANEEFYKWKVTELLGDYLQQTCPVLKSF